MSLRRHDGYKGVGNPTSPSRPVTHVTRLDPVTGNATAEQFDYSFDSAGRILGATFAQTPKNTVTAPLSNGSWYDNANLAAARARSFYKYTQEGQLAGVYTWWDTSGGSSYTSSFVRGNECDYETYTGMKRGLKTASKFLVPVSGQPLNWATQRTETYSYDANLDYLVGANYGGTLPNNVVSWSYDAAGNRSSDSSQPGTWSYDNLNRMTVSPGTTYINTVLGNRTEKLTGGVATNHSWDILNRMTQVGTASQNKLTEFVYRADGMRTQKTHTLNGTSTYTHYRYDGQMGTEDLEKSNTAYLTLTRYGLGARGIDVVSRTTASGNMVSYPLYDGHGNNVGSLLKSGSSFTVADEKTYDAWGGLRSGGGADSGKYCANLGHKQDEESGFVYMRARYYEPTSGRFASADSHKQGKNWFIYCGNRPTTRTDSSGNTWADESDTLTHLTEAGFLGALGMMVAGAMTSKLAMSVALAGFALLISWMACDAGGGNLDVLFDDSTKGQAHAVRISNFCTAALVITVFALRFTLTTSSMTQMINSSSVGSNAAAVVSAYAGVIGAFIAYEALLP